MKYILFLAIFFSLNAAGQVGTSRFVNEYFERYPLPSGAERGILHVGGVNHDSLYFVPFVCHHIYVAFLPDTVVWDIGIKSYPQFGYMDDVLRLNYSMPRPSTQKIVCILCHKVTEQQIKIINEPKN